MVCAPAPAPQAPCWLLSLWPPRCIPNPEPNLWPVPGAVSTTRRSSASRRAASSSTSRSSHAIGSGSQASLPGRPSNGGAPPARPTPARPARLPDRVRHTRSLRLRGILEIPAQPRRGGGGCVRGRSSPRVAAPVDTRLETMNRVACYSGPHDLVGLGSSDTQDNLCLSAALLPRNHTCNSQPRSARAARSSTGAWRERDAAAWCASARHPHVFAAPRALRRCSDASRTHCHPTHTGPLIACARVCVCSTQSSLRSP